MNDRSDVVNHQSVDMRQIDHSVPTPNTDQQSSNMLADDLLEGADAIAEFVFGDAAMRRKIYHLAQDNRFPVFKMGAKICARKSTVLRWIEKQEDSQSGCP